MNPEKIIFILLTGLLASTAKANGQDSLFSLHRRTAYANHLVRTGRFADAGREWYGVWKLDKRDSSAGLCVKMFRLAGLPDSALFYDAATGNLASSEKERLYAMVLTGQFEGDQSIRKADSFRFALVSGCIRGQVSDARKLVDHYRPLLVTLQDPGLQGLLKQLEKTKNIPVGMCVSASAVVPGSGRIIIGRYADAALSFSVTLTNAVLAGYTYQHLGARSLWPWFYGGLAAGFYGANIYGTYRDSRNEFTFRKRKLSNEAFHYLYNYLLVHAED